MQIIQFKALDSDHILQIVQTRINDITNLSNTIGYRDYDRNRATLNQVNEQLTRGTSCLNFPSSLLRNFLFMSFSLSRSDLLQNDGVIEYSEDRKALLQERAIWLSSLALTYKEIDTYIRLQGLGLWLTTLLHIGQEIGDAEQLVDAITKDLLPHQIESQIVQEQLKLQLVLFFAERIKRDPNNPVFSQDLAKKWLLELLNIERYEKMLRSTSIQLGVVKTNSPVTVGLNDPGPLFSDVDKPKIWDIPPILTREKIQSEYRRLLPVLQITPGITDQTRNQLSVLELESKLAIACKVFNFACRDHWKNYWSRGNIDSLQLVKDVSLFLLSVNKLRILGPDDEYQLRLRMHFFHLWMESQLPSLIFTSSLDLIVEDSLQLATYILSQLDKEFLLAGIVQAHLGELRRTEKTHEFEKYKSLIGQNKPDLEKLYKEYKSKTGDTDKYDGTLAWQELNPEESNQSSSTQIDDEMELTETIKEGSHERLYVYIGNNLEKIMEVLRQKLNIQIGPEYVMIPDGDVYVANSAARKAFHPDYQRGKIQLKQEKFEEASKTFDLLRQKMTGIPAAIANHFQAYALVKMGEIGEARLILKDLYDNSSWFPSVYWNYACCLGNEYLDMKMTVLNNGIDNAPHPQLLHCYIHLATLIEVVEEDRLMELLPLLPYKEALLWQFHLGYDNLDYSGREFMYSRLHKYVKKGAPTIPNPTDREIASGLQSTLVRTLLDRNQSGLLEFWLKCRERVASDRFDYWEIKTDFFRETNRIQEGIVSFIEEVNRRLNFISFRISQKKDCSNFVYLTKQRIDFWLRTCITDLKPQGQLLYNTVYQFDAAQTSARFLLLPKDEQLLKNYQIPTDESLNISEPEHLLTLLATLGGKFKSTLHEVQDVKSLRADFENLIISLSFQDCKESAEVLKNLLDVWGREINGMSRTDREKTVKESDTNVNNFKANLRKEIGQEEYLAALVILDCLDRVNTHFLRTLGLHPKISIDTWNHQPATIDLSVDNTAFSVFITCQNGDVPVRITNASAVMEEDRVSFALRDPVRDFPYKLSPDHNVLLTFETPPHLVLEGNKTVRIDLEYELSKKVFTAQSGYITLQAFECPQLPSKSPFVSGRPLELNEIDTLFHGRDEEQKEILESITNGQQIVRYIEGIRRVGKSSLLRSIEYKIEKTGMDLIPVQVKPDASTIPGQLLSNLLKQIAQNPEIQSFGVSLADESRFLENLTACYDDFHNELKNKIPNRKVVALLDDFQAIIDTAEAVRTTDPLLGLGFKVLLDKIRSSATPNASLLWVFAGQAPIEKFRTQLPGVLFWGDLKRLPIAFLNRKSIGDILKTPLFDTKLIVPDETITHLHELTAGHPECAQQMASYMFKKVVNEKRLIFTPSDATEAAIDLASSDDTFASTWYPLSQTTHNQNEFMASFLAAVPLGGSIEPIRLVPKGKLNDLHKEALNDLITNQVIQIDDEKKIGIKALVLEMWLRRRIPRLVSEIGFYNGSVALFVDIANLTMGTGKDTICINDITERNGGMSFIPLNITLKRVEDYCEELSPAPIAARWAVNYPKGSPAIVECNNFGYYIESIPEALFTKGSDDIVLLEKISDVESSFHLVNHFVIVTGDKDYRIKIDNLLQKGKFVHVLSWKKSLTKPDKKISYEYLANKYPERFSFITLEELIDQQE